MTDFEDARTPRAQRGHHDVLRVFLLGTFAVTIGETEVALPSNAQRVLAGLCVAGRPHLPHARIVLSGRLWPETSTERAQANLRTALWRIRQADSRLVTASQEQVRLGADVRVDVHDSLAQAGRLLSTEPLRADDVQLQPLTLDLLPGWESDWLLLERERVRQIQLHALEALSARLIGCGRFGDAIQAALAAIGTEPLRESAHNALIAAHLSEGNSAEAHRHFRQYSQLLWSELRLAPSVTFDELRERFSPRVAIARA